MNSVNMWLQWILLSGLNELSTDMSQTMTLLISSFKYYDLGCYGSCQMHCSALRYVTYTALSTVGAVPRTEDEIYDAVGLKAEPRPDRLAALRATTTETSSLNATMSQLEGQINIHSLPFDIILKICYFLTILDVVRWSQVR